MGRLFDAVNPFSYRSSGFDVERTSVTTDSNGDATVTVNFDHSITYTDNRDWGFFLSKRNYNFDWYYSDYGGSSVTITITNAPADTEITFEVFRVADRYNDLV